MTTTQQTKQTVTVLGAGALGAAIAQRLAGQGADVRIWNHHAAKADEAASGVDRLTAVDEVADAVDGADVLLTVLPTADVVAEVVAPVLPELRALWLQVSTVGPAGAKRLGELAAQHGVSYLDAPVSGSTQPAHDGQLVWLVAGSDEDVERARPVLDVLGKEVRHVGTGTSEGSALKLAINAWMTATTVVMSDVLALCDALGVGHDELRGALEAGPLAMPYALQKSQVMDGSDFAPGFAVSNALKDLHLAADEHTPSPVLREVVDRLQRTVDAGHGGDDLAAVTTTE